MKNKLSKIWTDPVGSKVIATAIIALFIALFKYYTDISFTKVFWDTMGFKIDLWLSIIITIVCITLILFKINFNKKKHIYTEAHQLHDKNLLLLLKDKIPTNGTIGFIRDGNFSGQRFSWDSFKDFEYANDNINNPDIVFIDNEFENLKTALFKNVHDYLTYLASNTFYVDKDHSSIPAEWKYDQPDRFDKVVKTMYDSEKEICKLYDSLIKLGKSKFGL